MATAEQLRNLQALYDAIPNYDGRAHSSAGQRWFCASGLTRYGFSTPTVALALHMALRARPLRHGGIGQALFGRRMWPTGDRRRARILRRHYGLEPRHLDEVRAIDVASVPTWHQWCRQMLHCIGNMVNDGRPAGDVDYCRPERDFYRDEADMGPLTEQQASRLKVLRGTLDTLPPFYIHAYGMMPEFVSVDNLLVAHFRRDDSMPKSDVAARLTAVQLRRDEFGISNRDMERMESAQRRGKPYAQRVVPALDRIIGTTPSTPQGSRGVATRIMPPTTLEAQVPRRELEPVLDGQNRRVSVRTTDRTNGQ